MILIKIFLLLIVFSLKYAVAEPFNGFYAGATTHHTSRNTQTTFPPHTTTHSNVTHSLSSMDKNSKKDYWGATLTGGYGITNHNCHYVHDCYYGIEAGIETPNEEEKSFHSSYLSSSSLSPSSPST